MQFPFIKIRPSLLLFVGMLLLSQSPMSALADAEPADARPNILFIYTDDQSHRTVGCYPRSHDWVRTPNIDRLAERGIRFSSAYIGTWCMPSRATLLTGHHPYGVESMRMQGDYPGSTYDPGQCPFWPSVFRENGYVTAQIGKWHTGTDTGYGRDWDYQVVWNRPRHTGNAGKYYGDQLIETNGGEAQLVEGYSTDNYTRWAVEFIEGKHRDPNKPWYLWLCYGAVHGPYTPADRHRDAYPDAEVPIPADIYPPRPGKPAYMQQVEDWVPGANGRPVRNRNRRSSQDEKTLTDWVRQYNQGVLAIDEGVSRLIDALEDSEQLENTLVVFTSDQGFAWGQHGFCKKLAPYDANLLAPLIVSMPGTLAEGAVCDTPVGGADLVPTFFNFAGIELPWKMHGRDLTPLLRDPEAERSHPVLISLTGATYGSDTNQIPEAGEIRRNGVPWYVMLRQGRYKYIRTLVADEIEELYDLEKDPQELTNLALDAEYADRLVHLRAAAVDELRRTDAGFVDVLPPVKMMAAPRP